MRRLLPLLTLLLALGAACGQDAPAPAPEPPRLPALASPLRLTPDDAACLAVVRSTQIAIGEQQVIAARRRLAEAASGARPRVEGTANYTRSGPGSSFQLPEEMGGGTIDFAPTATHRETVQMTVPLTLGGRVKQAKAAARAGIEAAQRNISSSEVQTAIAARQAVFGILRTQQLVVVAEQRLTSVTEHLRIAQAMFDAGTVAQFEVIQAQTEVDRARGDVIHARTGVAQAQAALRQILNAPQELEVIAEEGAPPQLPDGDQHALIGVAIDQRPELDALAATVRAREALVRLARAQYNPSTALVGQVTNASASVASTGLSWSLTASLAVPLYNGGEKDAKVTQAQADVETARLNIEQAQQQIALQVTQALLSVADSRESLTVAEKGEGEARERLRIAEVRFSNGVSLGVEVLDAQTALAAAQTTVVNARYDLQVATANLRAALGLADCTKESKP